MALKDEVEQLRRVPLFAGVSPARLKLLAFTSDMVSFAGGRILFNQGEQGDAAYVLLSGEVEVLIDSPTQQIKIDTIGENAIVGEIAILCDGVRTATIKTTRAVTALRIRKEDFLKLLAEFPEMTIQIMRVLAERLNHTTAALTEARGELKRLSDKLGG